MTDLIAQVVAYLRGMWRFRWWALLGSWLLCVAGYYWVYTLPNIYESTTRVYVDTQTALGDAIRGLGNSSDVREEVNKKLSEMVSVPALKKVARDTDLDLRATTPREMEQLVDYLRRTIEIRSLRQNSEYSITFRDPDPNMAQRVVQNMLSDFVGESLRENSKGTTDAMRFLEDQIRVYEGRLLAAEQRLAEFKKKHFGLMPGSDGDYYQRLEIATSKLTQLQATYRLKLKTRDELQSQLEGEEPTFGLLQDSSMGADSGVSGASHYDAQIDELRRTLAQQQLQLTDKHPDIISLMATLKTLEQQRAEELSARQMIAPAGPTFNPLNQNPVYQAMRIQLSSVQVELVELKSSLSEQNRVVSNLRKLVDTVPEVEAQLKRLNRDYDVTKSYHDDLLDRLESARLGEDADLQSDDIKFQVIDPPVLPIEPMGPNRPVYLTAILFAGLLFGLAISFLLDQFKPVFSTRSELRKKTGLPVLGTIGVVLMPRQQFIMRVQTLFFAMGLLALIGTYFGAIALEEQFVRIAGSIHDRGLT